MRMFFNSEPHYVLGLKEGCIMAKIPHLTVQERIMLHLLGKARYQENFEVPYSLTQHGIAEIVRVKRSYVSTANKELIQKYLVVARLSHVKGEGRRRRAYFLTQEGRIKAQKLKEDIEKLTVTLIDSEGERDVALGRINSEIDGNLSLLELLDSISDEGIFDAFAKTQARPSGHIDFSQKYPVPRYFLGREKELEEIEKWLKSKELKVLSLWGIAGVGKTTLMAKVAGDVKTKVFWYRFHDWSTPRNMLSRLSEFLEKEKKEALKLYLEENTVIDFGDIQALLQTQLAKIEALLIFDDFHRANESVLHLFEAIFEALEGLSAIKMVLIGREMPRFYDRRDVLVKKRVLEYQLEGLDRKSSLKLLEMRNIDSAHHDEIYECTKGHPLSLELVEATKNGLGKKNMEQYLSEEVLKRLTESEKRLLRFASVFRFPVPSDAYLSVPRGETVDDITHEVIDDLVAKSLIFMTDSHYDVHDVIREFFYKRLSPDIKSRYHLKVAEYFEDETDDLALIEAQYHHIKANNRIMAIKLAVRHGEHLIHRGYLEEFLEILSSISKDNIPSHELATLLLLEGDVRTTFGEWDLAKSLYEKALLASDEKEDKGGRAQAYYKIAAIFYRKGSFDEALKLNDMSLNILMEIKEFSELAKLYNNLGVIYWKKGAINKAIENYERSLEISNDLGDKRGIARAKNNLGIIFWEKGELEEAKKYYEQSLDLATELGDRQTVAILYDNLGEAARRKGDIARALKFYNKSLELSEKLGFRWQIAEVYRNMGKVYEGDEGKRYLKKAYEMFKNLGAEKDAEELSGKF